MVATGFLRAIRRHNRQFKIAWAFVLVGSVLLVSVPSGIADGEPDQQYEIGNFFVWPESDLNVLIVPPTHGPLAGPGLLPYGPEGALPTGTYLEATLVAIENWRHTIDVYAQQTPEHAWLSGIEIEEKVLLVDDVTPADVSSADILIVYPEHAGPVMGVSTNLGGGPGPRCVAANTLWLTITTLNHWDMYKLAGHEFGHCLGLSHTVGNSPSQDIMSQGGYPNDSYRCPSTLDMKGLVESFSSTFGEGAGGQTASIAAEHYERICLPGLA